MLGQQRVDGRIEFCRMEKHVCARLPNPAPRGQLSSSGISAHRGSDRNRDCCGPILVPVPEGCRRGAHRSGPGWAANQPPSPHFAADPEQTIRILCIDLCRFRAAAVAQYCGAKDQFLLALMRSSSQLRRRRASRLAALCNRLRDRTEASKKCCSHSPSGVCGGTACALPPSQPGTQHSVEMIIDLLPSAWYPRTAPGTVTVCASRQRGPSVTVQHSCLSGGSRVRRAHREQHLRSSDVELQRSADFCQGRRGFIERPRRLLAFLGSLRESQNRSRSEERLQQPNLFVSLLAVGRLFQLLQQPAGILQETVDDRCQFLGPHVLGQRFEPGLIEFDGGLDCKA